MKSRFLCQSSFSVTIKKIKKMDIEVLEKLFNYAAHLQHIFCKCAVAAHVLLCTVNVPLLHIYCCNTCTVIFRLQMLCCSTCAIMCFIGVGVRFGVGNKKKIILFPLSFYFIYFFGGD